MELDTATEIQIYMLEKALYREDSEIKRFTGSYDWSPAAECPGKRVQSWRTHCKDNRYQSATSKLRDLLSPKTV